jgi:hypothetical protein
MSNDKVSVDLTRDELAVIESALRTQEKILSVQSRADGDGTVRERLAVLQRVLRALDMKSAMPPQSASQGWSMMARGLFG